MISRVILKALGHRSCDGSPVERSAVWGRRISVLSVRFFAYKEPILCKLPLPMSDQLDKNLRQFIKGDSRRPQDRLPPELSWGKKWLVLIPADFVSLIALVFVASMFVAIFLAPEVLPSCACWAYIGLGLGLVGLFVDRILRHKALVHEARLEDRSEVEASIVEARSVEPRITNPEKPDDFAKKKHRLNIEVRRLCKLGPKGWTEYQVLPLNRMLVDFMKVDDLKAQARSRLAELEDYSEDSAFSYDTRHYTRLEGSINFAIESIDKKDGDPIEEDRASEELRAEIRTLIEHVADHHSKWAEGSVVIRGLITYCAFAIPIILIMGLLPILYPSGDKSLDILNWALLGISGSLAAVLRGLHKSDLVEVGNTEGKKELWRAVRGAAMGLFAGTVIYFIIRGGILPDGGVVPNLDYPNDEIQKHIALSVIWALGAGFSFERVFERLRSTTEG